MAHFCQRVSDRQTTTTGNKKLGSPGSRGKTGPGSRPNWCPLSATPCSVRGRGRGRTREQRDSIVRTETVSKSDAAGWHVVVFLLSYLDDGKRGVTSKTRCALRKNKQMGETQTPPGPGRPGSSDVKALGNF
ncbi:hypothetical protein ZHAS_00011861 [Anopheles sinensis]|uniref:Uncharacterized protein n=1 Tax=Anopheles sinensis TaxID=74873 RepID=A0A084W1D8_ANOSI|nr:hypothetical protein ZHAS_00011861 [Anopheles sinensis]